MAEIIQRLNYINKINYLIEHNPVVALIGSRQVGKTTLAREIAKLFPDPSFFDLENPVHFERLRDPMLTLQPLSGLIIIDEVQHPIYLKCYVSSWMNLRTNGNFWC
jgi:uncharacterized protein